MYIKILEKNAEKFAQKIPTRFDDITKEIKIEKYEIKAYKKLMEAPDKISYYKLGDKLGEKLNKLL